MTILIIVLVIFLVLLVGMLLAFLFTRMSHVVVNTKSEMEAEERAYSPGVTLGHRIKVESDYEEQLMQARKAAAKTAAAMPRGANNRVGRAGQSTLSTAGKNVSNDPMTAVRIARFHGWDGARTGIPASGIPAGGVAPAISGATVGVSITAPASLSIAPPTLIEITAAMSPEEVRKARIANSKAEAAYNKALKAAASGAPAPVAAGVAPTTVPVAVAPPVAVSIEPPKLIEITPNMAPEEVRKARVANAKAEAAYNKALKAAGASVAAVVAQPAASPVTPVIAETAISPVAIGIEPPQLIEITGSMTPEEIRRARVANAKAESAYNKALKAAGVVPSAVKAGATTTAAATVPAVEVAPVSPSASVVTTAPPVPAGIDPPKLIEITEGMSPEDIRRARVENAKASAAYNKALKAAGIDPASLK